MIGRLSLFLMVPLLGACSVLSSLNPFSSDGKEKMAELPAINGTASLKTLWQASVGKAEDYVFVPGVAGETVFGADANGALARFENGREVWRIKTEEQISGGAGADGKRVVLGGLKGGVFAFDWSGKALWKAKVGAEVLAAPVLAENIVVVRSSDSRITAFAADTGKRLWTFQRANPALTLRSNAGVLLGNGAVYAGFPGGKLVALKLSNGSILWEATVATPKGSTDLERIADVTSNPILSGRLICAVAFQGRVACFDNASGENIWARDIASGRGLDVDRQYLYVTDDKGGVYALDKDNGASIWKQDKLITRGTGRPLALPGYVAVPDVKGVIHLLKREDGSFAGRLETDGYEFQGGLQLVGRSALVAQNVRGTIYVLEPR